ncbi:MAG TPA: hypothetical protein VKX46_17120 [Ktedonobacteraceae bacterium]|jgi:hypothetical protein|nr:hypothetical protein [Ktedonobacteraceae bacterium]
MAEKYGLWPGVVAVVADADTYCVSCARRRYGEQAVMAVIDAVPGYEQYTDHESNPLTVVLSGSEDLHGMHCGDCSTCLCDVDCWCYQTEAVRGESCLRCGVTTSCTCWCGRLLCALGEDRYGDCGYCG